MTNPLHAAYYADSAALHSVEVVENVPLARNTFRVRVRCPVIARQITPGQFVMLRLADCDDPLLGRPLAMYDVIDEQGRPALVDLVYLVLGKMTGRLAAYRPGQCLEIWGPLGNGFPPEPIAHLIVVAGGIGQTPFVSLAKEFLGRRRYGQADRSAATASRVTMCYGARCAVYLAGLDDFRAAGVELRISTDDGSAGHHGLVTDLLKQSLAESAGQQRRIVCCGPERMMEAAAEIAHAAGVPCQVSLETPMACGIGICFSCVTKVRDAEGWDYKRTCVEGPIFDAAKIEW